MAEMREKKRVEWHLTVTQRDNKPIIGLVNVTIPNKGMEFSLQFALHNLHSSNGFCLVI